eukprot:g7785.t1
MDDPNRKPLPATVVGERPTLKTIAFMTGLGITTVSRALKDAPDIGSETKERVRLVARQLGYQPNRAGVRLRTGKTNVIALVLSIEQELMGFTSQMVQGISEVLAGTQYHLVVTPHSFEKDPMVPVRYILDTASADGVIISRVEPDDPRIRLMTERNMPFVTHGRSDMGIEHPYHDFDNEAYVYQAMERLASRGRRRIALLAPQSRYSYYTHSRDVDLVSKQSAEFLNWIRPEIHAVNEDIRQAGQELAKALLDRINGAPPGSLQSIGRPVWSELTLRR